MTSAGPGRAGSNRAGPGRTKQDASGLMDGLRTTDLRVVTGRHVHKDGSGQRPHGPMVTGLRALQTLLLVV